ncbi:putative membrane protein [Actinoplanes octamycinicus]|uniref:Putative membrane protein n=1 Tax=Actinoplanes octamycinicus TaxID=135948 RepID=A0A7W7H568_9ACTN|nr:DUF998 domain-containing protein [Actinoplanes octamycinicus]MBB4743857.1 putative membrane protein [Actinoplanes octamycinicus]GIE58486.1 hypothetical protein Aoc01nite_38880 [Actinoplanes octamycinicus]
MPTTSRTTLGALCWAAAAPLFLIANLVVGLAWTDPAFSWMTNNVSDLGNVTCGVWDTTRPRYVCSPWHDAMNVAFVLTAALLVAGLVLTWRSWGAGRSVRWSRRLVLAGATGLGLAGAFPADVNENLHLLAALLVFLAGNAGLVAAACVPRGTLLAPLRPVTITLAGLGVIGSVLFIAQQGPLLGIGGMERLSVFALPVWACVAGLHLHLTARRAAAPKPAAALV